MATMFHWSSSALIEQSKKHIARLQTLIGDSRDQSRLALDLIAQSQRYIALIEEIEASRIEGMIQARTAPVTVDPKTGGTN